MVRGGHIDLTVLGALEVDEEGNLANWMIPGKMVKGMGGAMDLVAGAKRVDRRDGAHDARTAATRSCTRCTLPLTGLKVVNQIVTELAVIEVTPEGLLLREIAERHDARGGRWRRPARTLHVAEPPRPLLASQRPRMLGTDIRELRRRHSSVARRVRCRCAKRC